jgi:hypothetical protein
MVSRPPVESVDEEELVEELDAAADVARFRVVGDCSGGIYIDAS